jgi:photosystem II stability/assembly factor-like uncharacterized protein
VPQDGRIVSINRPPERPQEILAGSETGGLFRSVNGGATFQWVDGLPGFRIGDIAYAPGRPDIVLLTLRSDFRVGAANQILLRSCDGGHSWYEPPTAHPTVSDRCPEHSAGYAISFQPDSQTVYAGTTCGVAVSDDLGEHWTWEPLNPTMEINKTKTQDRITSVLAQAGGHVIAVGDRGAFVRETRSGAWRWTSTKVPTMNEMMHGIAASPIDPRHVFVGGLQEQLLESFDGGENWSTFPPPFTSGMHSYFVRTTQPFGAASGYQLYVGNGTQLFRLEMHDPPGAPPTFGATEELPTGTDPTSLHADLWDVMFASDGHSLLFAAGDGGIQSPDSGTTWHYVGSGAAGLDALQIQDVTGQWIGGVEGVETNLYFASQDNSIHASRDGGKTWPAWRCCEGGHLQIAPTVVQREDARLVGYSCGTCANFRSGAMLENQGLWPNAPDVDGAANPGVEGIPILLGDGWYLQNTNSAANPTLDAFRLTKDFGGHWEPGAALLLLDRPRSLPVVVREAGNYTLLQAVQRTGAIDPGFGLARVRFPALFVDRIDDGLDRLSVATFGDGQDRPVLASNPTDSRNLLAVDLGALAVKYSPDGGENWYVDYQLSQLVLQSGRYSFLDDEGSSIVSVLGWDPSNRCHILAGARQGGIYRSQDGGWSWEQVRDTEKIPDVSAFYFPPSGPVVVGSYGRGLWKLDIDRQVRACRPRAVPIPVVASSVLIDPATGAPLRGAGGRPLPPDCQTCAVIVAYDGTIAEAETEDDRLVRFSVRGGVPYEFDSAGQEIPLEVPNVEAGELDTRRVAPAFARLRELGQPVRGLVVSRGRLVALLVGSRRPPYRPARIPRTRAVSSDMAGGLPRLAPGEAIAVYGTGFAPRVPVQLSLRGARGEAVFSGEAVPDLTGSFAHHLTVASPAGRRVVRVEQREGNRLVQNETAFLVMPRDGY